MKKSHLLIVALVILLILAACAESTDPKKFARKSGTESNGLQYWSLEIEGMPCIYVHHKGYETSYAGLTCDWSKWRGNPAP